MTNGKWKMENEAVLIFHFPFAIFHLSFIANRRSSERPLDHGENAFHHKPLLLEPSDLHSRVG